MSEKSKAKKARLLPIHCGDLDYAPQAELVRLSRRFLKQQNGRLVAYVGAFMYRENGTNNIRVLNTAHGKITLADQMMLAKKLESWIGG